MSGKNDEDIAACRAAIAALEGQRGTLGDAVVELVTAPLRARLASLPRPGGVQLRRVTVLFDDVVNSTVLAQGLDAEGMLSLLCGPLQRMAAIVEQHRGRVLRFTGDGVKAAFGKDEARRACHQVLAAAGDAEAPSLLDRLHADARSGAADLADTADATDHERRAQAVPHFREITAAHRRTLDHRGAASADLR